ncbi:2'-5' RNA ligase family protein [Oscillospiraceae bacterium LTW-04]|nr:2'-5' RNA ligase family protein [Oscillospiraceae bacterium MB24-C1]
MGTFDNQTNQKVYRIKEKLKAQGISIDAYEPHITFGIYTELDEISLFKWISKVVAQHKKIQISFNHFGFFPDARYCFLAPCSSYGLLELHSNIHEKFDNCCTDKGCLYSLKQKNWSPHMTIASIELGQTEKLLSILWESFSPFTAELTRLKITSSDTSKDVGVFELRG